MEKLHELENQALSFSKARAKMLNDLSKQDKELHERLEKFKKQIEQLEKSPEMRLILSKKP